MSKIVKLAVITCFAAALSGCVGAAVGTLATNEDVQDAVIDGTLDFLDI